ncbi:hypothetical protein Salat_2531300 [Sesamum alatum]|uniref:Uncharacterized protein n=1 Tax=Sesamum alatum TaxID=300844 RepID=A0AAE1XT41_9LAMI|nr:hypothetical protein Salat_2531300 [Sesamum alatum]
MTGEEGEGATQQGDGVEGVTQHNEGGERVTQQGEGVPEPEAVRVEDIGKGWGFDTFATNEEFGGGNIPTVINKGKRKTSELNEENCSTFDDSSDSDYQQPDNVDESSEEYDMLEDNEGFSQEDVPKTRKMKKTIPSFVVADEDWNSNSNATETVGGGSQSNASKHNVTTGGGMGRPSQATTRVAVRQRKPTIQQVLQNIKAKKRAWKP